MTLNGKGFLELLLLQQVEHSICDSTLVPVVNGSGTLDSSDLDISIELPELRDLLVCHSRYLLGLNIQVLPQLVIVLGTVVNSFEFLLCEFALLFL